MSRNQFFQDYIFLLLNDFITMANARRVMLVADPTKLLVVAQAEGFRSAHLLEPPLSVADDEIIPIDLIKAGFVDQNMTCVSGKASLFESKDEQLRQLSSSLYFSTIPVVKNNKIISVIYMESNDDLQENPWVHSEIFRTIMGHFSDAIEPIVKHLVAKQPQRSQQKIEEELETAKLLTNIFLDQMMRLHELVLDLMKVGSLDRLLKQSVALATGRLRFDRICIFKANMIMQTLQATYGVDTKGQVIDLHHLSYDIPDHPRVHTVLVRPDYLYVDDNATIWEDGQPLCKGWNAAVGLWVRGKIYGYMAVDNLFSRTPIQSYQKEILRMLALNLSQLIERKLDEEKLLNLNKKLEQLSKIDALTNLHNRRVFNESLTEEWQRAKRNGRYIGLLLIDIDYFKPYNDHYGHAEGDKTLILVGKALSVCARRAGELVTRYGGEEFAIILPESDLDQCRQVATNINKTIRDLCIPHEGSKSNEFVTVSIGVCSIIPEAHEKEMDLIHCADNALYAAKEAGRNTAYFEQQGQYLLA